ncbi:MAG: DUF1700 domain-containing protein [Coriobacteriales bacterium]|jgi:uncharacterized membrane protein|nr:DUF1700 domain-containing protein [Coriobacteriales bacterium]
MTKDEFLSELRKRLKKLPESEQANALAYYEEYLQEAGPAGEQAAIAALGSPAQVASAIIGDYAIKQVDAEKDTAQKKDFGPLKTLWIVVLAVIASPIALPLAAAFVVVLVALLITVFTLYLTLFVSAIAVVAISIVSIVVAVIGLFVAPPKAALLLGLGLMGIAAGTALFIFSVWISRLTIQGITWLFAKLLKRKGDQA